MAFKPMKIPVSKDPPVQEWRLDSINGGVVYSDLEMKLLNNQSPDMMNLWFKEKVLTKRYGQEYLFNSLGAFPILSTYDKLYKGYLIFSTSTKLYKCDLSTGITTLLYSSLTASKGSFFVFKNKSTGADILYYINGYEYIQYDGTTVIPVVGYIPTVLMGRSPTGGGTVLEQYNKLSAGFITSFSPNGSATTYTLPQINLDSTIVTATLGGVSKVEGTDFTVNRTTGIVTFSVAPTAGTDTLKIAAYKTSATSLAQILACKYAITFGGNNDTRVFMAGDSTTYYYSGLQDPTYFPENQYNNAGVDNTFITGFGKQYNTLVVFKQFSLYAVTYSVSADGSNPTFSLAPFHSSIGCDMPYTIQNINNNLVWCNTYNGVYTLISDTQIKDEKNIKPLSANINGTLERKGLLHETLDNLKNATTIDFFGMYWICVGSKVWAWDYSITPFQDSGDLYKDQLHLAWFPFNNINANCFFGNNQDLYYGDRTNSQMVHFKNSYIDFSSPINGYWKSKILDFDLFDWKKIILEARYRTKSDVLTHVTIDYYWDDGNRTDSTIDTVGSFNWATFNWSTFVWSVINYAKTFTKKPRINNTVHFGIKFSNNTIGNNLSILDLSLLWIPTRRCK